MPVIEVRAFCNANGESPIIGWLETLSKRAPKAFGKCLARILRLAELGYEINRNRTESAYLQDGIYELRVRHEKVNYRILYAFVDGAFACLTHGITKEDRVPHAEIERAMACIRLVESDPRKFTTDFDAP